ncbi:MAG: SPFH domain-containing protein [Ardenticatenaceae bacterium]|nr:SPFH domain-containing protein [Ardenticatenaceae bacterium]
MWWIVGVLFFTIAGVMGTLWGGLPGLLGTAVFGLLAVTVGLVGRAAYVRVPEMETAVVQTNGGRFVRFLPPGSHWIRPFLEQVTATLATDSTTVQGRTSGLQTIGGLSLTIAWRLSYTLNVFQVPAARQPKVARLLARNPTNTVRNHLGNVLQHIVGEYTIEQLTLPGAHKQLEIQAREAIDQRLRPLGFEVSRVMIGAIEMPPHVKSALEAVHERQMQAENEAKALSLLQQVVSQFSDADMQRLIELERIRNMGQHGVILPYPTLFEADRVNGHAYARMVQ